MSEALARHYCAYNCDAHFATSQELEAHITEIHPWVDDGEYPDPAIFATNAGSTSTSGYNPYTSNAPNTGHGFNPGHSTMGPAQAGPSNPTGAGHSDSEGSEDGYQCIYRGCDATFATKDEAIDHMIGHDAIIGVFCGVSDCGEYFHTQEELDLHVALVHSDDTPEAGPTQTGPSQAVPSQVGPSQAGPAPAGPTPAGPGRASRGRERCNICGRMVTNISAHVGRVHNREKHFQCHHCTHTFFGAPELRKHLRIKHSKTWAGVGRANARRPTWRCHSCNFVGTSQGALNAHRNFTHPGPIVGNAPQIQQLLQQPIQQPIQPPIQPPNQPQVNNPGAQTQEDEDEDVEMQD